MVIDLRHKDKVDATVRERKSFCRRLLEDNAAVRQFLASPIQHLLRWVYPNNLCPEVCRQ
jgi:hypothetical protein